MILTTPSLSYLKRESLMKNSGPSKAANIECHHNSSQDIYNATSLPRVQPTPTKNLSTYFELNCNLRIASCNSYNDIFDRILIKVTEHTKLDWTGRQDLKILQKLRLLVPKLVWAWSVKVWSNCNVCFWRKYASNHSMYCVFPRKWVESNFVSE